MMAQQKSKTVNFTQRLLIRMGIVSWTSFSIFLSFIIATIVAVYLYVEHESQYRWMLGGAAAFEQWFINFLNNDIFPPRLGSGFQTLSDDFQILVAFLAVIVRIAISFLIMIPQAIWGAARRDAHKLKAAGG